jgi:hypothetical protein
MADDSSGPPLSRRVPGATNRPKPQMRMARPVLPEDLMDRLRPKQDAETETASAQPTQAGGEDRKEREPQAPAQNESSRRAAATWYVVPDSPASPTADSGDTTQPVPVITAPVARGVRVAAEAKPKTREGRLPRRGRVGRAAGAQAAGPAKSRDVPAPAELPQPRRAAQTHVPHAVEAPSAAQAPQVIWAPAAQSPRAAQPADLARTGERAEHPSVAGPPDLAKRAQPAKPAVTPPLDAPSPAGRPDLPVRRPPTGFWRRCLAAVSAALSHPGPQQSADTLLRPLFADSLSIEEMVASVRAQDAGRRSDQARRYRMAAVVVLIVVVAVAVAVVAVV